MNRKAIALWLLVMAAGLAGCSGREVYKDPAAEVEDRVEDHWYTLNAILADCGMPLLDPRNATDWLVLYAITADNVPMSERMEAVIDCMFNEHLQTL